MGVLRYVSYFLVTAAVSLVVVPHGNGSEGGTLSSEAAGTAGKAKQSPGTIATQGSGTAQADAASSYVDPATGMEFVLVKGGCYDMGDAFGDGDDDERPVHRVCVNDLYLGAFAVTVGEFRKFKGDSGYVAESEKKGCAAWTGSKWQYDRNKNWQNPGFPQNDRHPVVCVSWNDAAAFVKWLSGKGKKQYRLPTEAEWEYAARSRGKQNKYGWGNGAPSGNIADESAKRAFPGWAIWDGYDDGSVYTAPVGSFRPNDLGLYDMTGNAWQWLSDWYDDGYYRESLKDNPSGPAGGDFKVYRGGSWFCRPKFVRTSKRNGGEPSRVVYNVGFRVAFPAR